MSNHPGPPGHIMTFRKTFLPIRKDPLSYEFIQVEDAKRQLRFERECPNPVWWYDYTNQEAQCGPKGSSISYIETPDVRVLRSGWTPADEGLTVTLAMRTDAAVDDYAIVLWGLPAAFDGDASRIRTTAKEFILARNVDGEFHLVLIFDLKPDAELRVIVLGTPGATDE